MAWKDPWDPQIYGDLEVDATAALAALETIREQSGIKVTATHLVGKAVAHALVEVPQLNRLLSRSTFKERDNVSIFFIATTHGGNELTGVKVEDVDKKSLAAIATELSNRVGGIRKDGTGDVLAKTKGTVNKLPRTFLRPSMRLSQWLTNDLGMHLPKLGMPKQAFGSAMVTSVGMLGLDKGYAPLAFYYRVPFLALVGRISERPVVVDGEIVARPVLPLTGTLDHRYVDGFIIAKAVDAIRDYLADPLSFE